MNVAIVTGVSKGLGKSITTFLFESGISVYGISRTEEKTLHEVARENNVIYKHFICDLGDFNQTNNLVQELINNITRDEATQLYVVNNAAVVHPIHQATQTKGKDIAYHYQVNVISPMMILNSLLQWSQIEEISLIGANISSGAANRPIFGWSTYCSSKSSLNMYTKTVALEQEELQTDNKIFAFNPGVMDTEMQAQIRKSDESQMKEIDAFKNYKRKNLLSDTEAVAGVLVDILTNEVDVKNGKIYDVRDYI